MKRNIAVLLLVAMLVTLLSGCGVVAPVETQAPATNPTENTSPPTETTTNPPQTQKELTHQDIIDGLNDYAKERDLSFRVSNVQEFPQDAANRTSYGFRFMDDVIEVVVWETDGVVDGIFVTVWPSKYREGMSNPNQYTDQELVVACRGLVLLPVLICQQNMDASECMKWHDAQMNETMYQDGVFLKFAYQSEEWKYDISLTTLSVNLSATKLTGDVQQETVNVAPPKMTREELIGALDAYAEAQGFGKVTDLKAFESEYVGMTRHQFKYMDGCINVLLDEQDGVVEGVMAWVYLKDIPSQLAQGDLITVAAQLTLIPLMVREGAADLEIYNVWHNDKIIANRCDYGFFGVSDYSNDYWRYRHTDYEDHVMTCAYSLSVEWVFSDDEGL